MICSVDDVIMVQSVSKNVWEKYIAKEGVSAPQTLTSSYNPEFI